MTHTICTFNANNLFARYRFSETFPGDMSGKSKVQDPAFGYLPVYNPSLFELFNETQRELAVAALTDEGKSYPDVVCMQEVESLLALRKFNEDKKLLNGKYKHALLIDSRDFRQIDVGILSNLEILSVRTHMDEPDPAAPVNKPDFLFSRDCLEVVLALNKSGSKTLTLFVNHLKSKFSMSAAERQKADALRQRQATRVRDIVHERFPGQKFNTELFAVIGDCNDEPLSAPMQPLAAGSGLVDVIARIPKAEDRWTHWFRSANTVSQLDYILVSPALDAASQGNVPRIERRGVSFASILADGKPGPKKTHFESKDGDPNPVTLDFRFGRFKKVTSQDYASDHCPVFFDTP